MKKFTTAIAALGMAVTAFAQHMPQEGKYYYLVNGYTGTYSQNEQRPNSCFGVKELNGDEVYGLQVYEADDERLLWTFVAKPGQAEGETPLYAMVNKADEYVPVLGFINNQNGQVYQDTRFAVESFDGEIPDEAYGFILTAEGTISAANIAQYDATIHGMHVGDTYLLIRPEQYRNDKNDDESVADNPNYYLNAAGSGRQFVVNLWAKESFPSSQRWILVPEVRDGSEPEPEPVVTEGPETGVFFHLINGRAGTASASDIRPNSAFATIEDYYGVAEFNAEELQQHWQFLAKPNQAEGETPLYAMVNKQNEYVTGLGEIVNQNGSVGQDTRFPVTAVPEEGLPDDAYAFDVIVRGEMTEDGIDGSYDPEIHGMQPGNKYITIRPVNYRNDKNDDEAVAANPTLYLNAAGSGRNFYINLWALEGGTIPETSQYWILIPAQEVTAPEVPALTCSIEPVNGVVTIPLGESAIVTITTDNNAVIAYAFTTDDTEPAFNVLEENTATLAIDKAGTLHYYAARGSMVSDTATLTFAVDPSSGITEITDETPADSAIFDLQGRRVIAPARGLYIVNGKIVIR